ncbi:hypothetical protein D3C80_985040 [compost metagenome]
MIQAPEVLQHAFGIAPDLIAGAVHALPGLSRERIGHELLGGQRRTPQIAPGQPGTAQVQLAWPAGLHHLAGLVEDVADGIVDRRPDIGLAPSLAQGAGGIGGVLRWPVQVEHPLHPGQPVEVLHKALGQGFPRQVDYPHRGGNLPGLAQGADRRGYCVDQPHPLTCRQLRQVQGVVGQHQGAAQGQGHE